MTSDRAGILKDIIVSPKKAFSEIGENGNKFFPVAFIILLGTAVSSPMLTYFGEASNHFYFVGEQLSMDFSSIFFEIEFGFFFGIGFTALVYWFGKKLGGQGSFKGVFSSLCYSSLPIAIVGVMILLPLGIFGGRFLYDSDTLFSPFFVGTILVGVASTIWGLVLSILAIMKSHQLGIGKSIGVGFLAAIVILVLALPVLFLTDLNSEIPIF